MKNLLQKAVKYAKELNTPTFRSLTVSDDLDKLNILTFWQILKDNNALLLDVNYKDGKRYANKEETRLNELFSTLYDQYFTLRDDGRGKFLLKSKLEEIKLVRTIKQLKENAEFLLILKRYEGLYKEIDVSKHELNTYKRIKRISRRIKIKELMGLDYNLKVIDGYMSALANRLNEVKSKVEVKHQKEVINFYDTVANAESWLERNLPIEKISVTRWLAYEKQIQKKAESQRKIKNGNR